MSDHDLFGAVALLAVLLWLGARMVPPAHRRLVERLAFWLLGGGLVVALLLTVGHFIG